MSSLDEFRHLTLPQLRLFCKTVTDEYARQQTEKKLNRQLKERKGGPIRVKE